MIRFLTLCVNILNLVRRVIVGIGLFVRTQSHPTRKEGIFVATANQIAYWKLQEEKRSNVSRETETNRSNLASEAETNRHNLATEEVASGSLTETIRSNLAKEAETNRANLAKEAENYRSNVAKETETHRSNVAVETETARSNAAKELETLRHNKATELAKDKELAQQLSRIQAEISRMDYQNALDIAKTVESYTKAGKNATDTVNAILKFWK